MRRIVLLVGLIVSVAPIALAQAQQPFVPGDAEANAQLAKLVEAARDNGLPTDPIVAKVQYAVRVVHAEPSLIVASARKVAARLEVARDALAPASPTDIAAGADALGAGATKEALHTVRLASGGQSVSTSLGVLAQLLGSNVPLKRATEIVTSFLKRGATPQQLVALGNNVNDDVTHGAAALAALDTRARFLSGVLAPGGGGAAAPSVDGLQFGSQPRKP